MKCALWIAIVVATVHGCATASGGVDLRYDERAEDWHDVVSRVRVAHSARPTVAAVGVTAEDDAVLVAYDDTGKARWRVATTGDATVFVTADLVLTVEGDEVVARSANDGQSLFRHALEGMMFVGAAQGGDILLLVCAHPSITTTQPLSRITAVDARSGRLNWTRVVSAAVGAPIVRAAVAFVPWNRQAISAIDLSDGRELARHRPTPSASVEWIADHNGTLTFGAQTLHPLLPTAPNAACDAVASPYATAPSQPAIWPSSYRSPRHTGIQIAYAIDTDPTGCPRFSADRAYLVFYRYVFALDPSGMLAWVQVLPNDVVAAHATNSGVLVIDTHGIRRGLAAKDGHPTETGTMGDALRSAIIVDVPMPSVATDASTSVTSKREQLLRTILDVDNRLVVARAYAVEQLATDHDAMITADLLAAYEHPRLVAGLRATIARALLARRTGSEYLVAALDRHHDFLANVTPPPLEIVAPTLSAMGAVDSVRALVAHLHDPATDGAGLVAIAEALLVLGDAHVVDELVTWLRRYRLSIAVASEPDAVRAIARAALKLGDDAARVQLVAIADGGDTTPVYASTIAAVLTPPDIPPAEIAVVDAQPSTPKTPLPRLTQDVIDAAFAQHTDRLRPCIARELERNPTLAQVRTAFVAEPSGVTRHHVIAPNTEQLRTCLLPVLRDAVLSPFAGESVVSTFVVRVRRASSTDEAASSDSPEPIDAAWWRWYERPTPPSEEPPWWTPYIQRDGAWLADISAAPAPVAPVTSPGPDDRDVSPPAPSPTRPTHASDAWWLPSDP